MQSDGFGAMHQEGLMFYFGPIQDQVAHTP